MEWGGHGNVPCTSCVICLCCYAAEISGVVATLYVATLQRSLVLLLRCVHEGVGWGGWGGHVNGYFVRYMLLRCRDLWCCCYGVWRKGWGGHVNVPATSYVICG